MEEKELCATAEAVENTAPTEAELIPVTLNVRRDQVGMLKTLGGEVFLQSILQQIDDDELDFFLPLSILTEEQKELFIKGWQDANGKLDDAESDRPWFEPWKWPQLEAIEVHSDRPESWGYTWYVNCDAYILGYEEEDEDFVKEVPDPKDRMLHHLKNCEAVRFTPEYEEMYA